MQNLQCKRQNEVVWPRAGRHSWLVLCLASALITLVSGAWGETLQVGRVLVQVERERRGWGAYYDVLDRLEQGIAAGDAFAEEMQGRAKGIVDRCRVRV